MTRDALAFEAGAGAFHLLAADVQQEGLLYAVVDVLRAKGDGHRESVTPPVPSIVAVSPWRYAGGNPGAADFVDVDGARESTGAFDLSAYALLHAATKSRATVGARARGRGFGLEVVVAADGQSTVDSDDGGQLGAHLALDVRTDLPWPKGSQAPRPWVGAGIESTFGDVGEGRALVAPGPTQHGRLTGLDVLRRDHTVVPRLWLGATDPTLGLQMDLRVSLLFGLGGDFADASGKPILAEETIARDLLQNDGGAALGTAVDVALIAPLWRGEAGSVGLEAVWSGVVGPVVPAGFAQQILVGLRFTTPTR